MIVKGTSKSFAVCVCVCVCVCYGWSLGVTSGNI